MKKDNGKLITIVGIDSVLKSINLDKVIKDLQQKKYSVSMIKYPVYDCYPTGPKIKEYIVDGNPKEMTPLEFQKLCAENRRDYEIILLEELDRKDFVIADMYSESGIVYGTFEGLNKEDLIEMNKDLIQSDLVILCDGVPKQRSYENPHRFEGLENGEKIRQIHLDYAMEFGWPIVTYINKDNTISDIESWIETVSESFRA
jgi:thymidylate kinase